MAFTQSKEVFVKVPIEIKLEAPWQATKLISHYKGITRRVWCAEWKPHAQLTKTRQKALDYAAAWPLIKTGKSFVAGDGTRFPRLWVLEPMIRHGLLCELRYASDVWLVLPGLQSVFQKEIIKAHRNKKSKRPRK